MEILTLFAVFLFGAVIGSFLNVVIFRYHSGAWKSGRSLCFACNTTLSWFENVPVLSYLYLKGKCRHCKSSISPQYIFVELFTASLFVLVYLKSFGVVESILVLLALSTLVIILVYDIHHKIIPDGLVSIFIAASVLYMIYVSYVNEMLTHSVWDYFAGPILFIPFFALWYFSKGTWMGLGDGKLVLGIGWFLGISQGISAVMLAFWIGAVVSVGLLVVQKLMNGKRIFGKRLSMKSEIPFAPFLIAGFLLVFFFDIGISQFIL